MFSIAESKQELQEVLEEWKGVFKKHELRMSLEKTGVMWVGHRREGGREGEGMEGGREGGRDIRLDGKEIK